MNSHDIWRMPFPVSTVLIEYLYHRGETRLMTGTVYFHFFSAAEIISGCQIKVVGW